MHLAHTSPHAAGRIIIHRFLRFSPALRTCTHAHGKSVTRQLHRCASPAKHAARKARQKRVRSNEPPADTATLRVQVRRRRGRRRASVRDAAVKRRRQQGRRRGQQRRGGTAARAAWRQGVTGGTCWSGPQTCSSKSCAQVSAAREVGRAGQRVRRSHRNCVAR